MRVTKCGKMDVCLYVCVKMSRVALHTNGPRLRTDEAVDLSFYLFIVAIAVEFKNKIKIYDLYNILKNIMST